MTQGMPKHIKKALTKIIRNFIWEENTSPRIALDQLYHPIDQGGLNLLNLKARNEAVEIVWLKAYLNLSPLHPTWAKKSQTSSSTPQPHEAPMHKPDSTPSYKPGTSQQEELELTECTATPKEC